MGQISKEPLDYSKVKGGARVEKALTKEEYDRLMEGRTRPLGDTCISKHRLNGLSSVNMAITLADYSGSIQTI